MKYIYKTLITLSLILGLSSCEGFLDKTPTDKVVASNALLTIDDAAVAVNGLYTKLKYYSMYGSWMATMGDMRADNLYPRELNGYSSIIYTLQYDSESNSYFSLWQNYYTTILRANTLIANIETLKADSADEIAVRDNYLGEAYAVRALCYFDLARLYGKPYLYDKGASLGAVLITQLLSPSESEIPRSTVKETYAQVLSDITEAGSLLSKERNPGHFNYWAAKLLKSRVELYMGDYSNAYADAVEVIKSSPYKMVENAGYVDYWGREGNNESVLELLITTDGDIDPDGGFYTLYHNLWFEDLNAGASVIPTKKWRELFTNTPNDVRAQFIAYDDPETGVKRTGEYWLKKFVGNKDLGYTFRRNNPKVMRITEAYLIAAEAGLECGAADASDYLNAVRRRADATCVDVTATLNLVQTERQKEFIGEGHRFFDVMRRGGTITRDLVSDPHDFAGTDNYKKSFSWDYYKVALPISKTELISYEVLQQTEGYK